MADGADIEGPNARAGALFILAPGRLEALSQLAARAGWRVVATPGEAGLAVVELAGAGPAAAGADADALAAVPALREETGAVLALVPRGAAGLLERAYAAGATHFLSEPAGADEFAHALRFAARGRRPHDRRRGDPAAGRETGLEAARAWAAGRLAAGRPVAAVRVALARFDIVNAAYGRARGDAILEEAGGRLAALARDLWGADGLAVRTGGAEFALVGDGAVAAAGRAAAEAARALAEPFRGAAVGARLGSADSGDGDDGTAVLGRAGDAMRRAGEGGGLLHAPAGTAAASDELAADLHHALRRGEIAVLFQPQAEVATGRVVGVEALARWRHPSLGPLGAEPLFAAAARGGLDGPLSDHIRGLVLARVAAWPAALAGLRVSVNVMAADLARPDFADRMLAEVAASGVDPGRLTAEVTETGLIADLPAAAALLGRLRAAGCRTAIDDFGTGYSSLAYLQALPLDYLKLDRALTVQAGDRVVVAGALAMARSLGLATIAEGVETEAQRLRLAAEGCELYQGFLCAGPLDEAALAGLMEARDAG